ncbi:DUF3016 domain-containing protein [Solimonas sp. K1W22B-7]|uniref:DUF3016 domain-containing protein n=1 Tax=Solimonas sp. K1W22B-7 TaxID=2303331 RepID=UPI000E335B82|nr:DUF3016 domain-containing protein [Solimonas sp. K1W22B-7]AXQ28771.1 DUF3016 domain-containing protein [Solimonas sp. K1W22B-7]
MRVPTVLASLALLLPLAVSAAGVELQYVQPDRYTDAGLRPMEREPSAALKRELETELQRLGQRYLLPDQTLTLEILDLDLAGQFRWWDASRGEVRVMSAATWPRIRLRYRLMADGRELAKGEESISDRDYLNAVSARSSDPLRYEKNMLGDWFRSRFGGGRQPA